MRHIRHSPRGLLPVDKEVQRTGMHVHLDGDERPVVRLCLSAWDAVHIVDAAQDRAVRAVQCVVEAEAIRAVIRVTQPIFPKRIYVLRWCSAEVYNGMPLSVADLHSPAIHAFRYFPVQKDRAWSSCEGAHHTLECVFNGVTSVWIKTEYSGNIFFPLNFIKSCNIKSRERQGGAGGNEG